MLNLPGARADLSAEEPPQDRLHATPVAKNKRTDFMTVTLAELVLSRQREFLAVQYWPHHDTLLHAMVAAARQTCCGNLNAGCILHLGRTFKAGTVQSISKGYFAGS